MKLCQIREYSKTSLKGNRGKSFVISLLLPASILFFRLAELCVASVILYLKAITPMELFYNSPVFWIIFTVICNFLKYMSVAVIFPSVIKYFSDTSNIKYSNSEKHIFKRSFITVMIIKIISFLALIPSAFFTFISVKLIISGYESGNPDIIFLSVHSIMFTLFSLVLWIWVMLGMTALPFLIINHSETGIFKLTLISFKIMKNSRKSLIKIILFYILSLLIPFAFIYTLPEFFTSTALYINICIKEAEYIGGDNFYCQNRKAHNSPKLFNGKKGYIQTSADQT